VFGLAAATGEGGGVAALIPLNLFISRRTKDQPIADRIQRELEEACPDKNRLVVHQSQSISPGMHWPERLDALLREANCLFVIYRGEPIHWLAFETARFDRDPQEERVIAIHPPDDRPPWLENRQCVEASREPLTNLFNEIIRSGSPDGGDEVGTFVALNPDYKSSKIATLVDEIVELFGKQVKRLYGFSISLSFTEGDDIETGDTRTGCRWIGDDTRVSDIGQDGALRLFNRGGDPECTWEELTRHHRKNELIDALAAHPAPLTDEEAWSGLSDEQRAEQVERWRRSFVTAWMYEIDAAVNSVREGTNLEQPRRTLRAKIDGELYMPAIIRATLTQGAKRVVESVDISLIRQPRPTSSAGPRFKILDVLERLRDEVIKPASRMRERVDQERLEDIQRALATIESEVRAEKLFDDSTIEQYFRVPGPIIENGEDLAIARDGFEQAMREQDPDRAIKELGRLEDAVYRIWGYVVEEYAQIIKEGLDKLVDAQSDPGA
jgi:hypothetical protein